MHLNCWAFSCSSHPRAVIPKNSNRRPLRNSFFSDVSRHRRNNCNESSFYRPSAENEFEIDVLRVGHGIRSRTIDAEIVFGIRLNKNGTSSSCDRTTTTDRESVSKPADLLLFEIFTMVRPESPIFIRAFERDASPNIIATVRSSISAIVIGSPGILCDHHLFIRDHFSESVNVTFDCVPNMSGQFAGSIVRHNWAESNVGIRMTFLSPLTHCERK